MPRSREALGDVGAVRGAPCGDGLAAPRRRSSDGFAGLGERSAGSFGHRSVRRGAAQLVRVRGGRERARGGRRRPVGGGGWGSYDRPARDYDHRVEKVGEVTTRFDLRSFFEVSFFGTFNFPFVENYFQLGILVRLLLCHDAHDRLLLCAG